MAAGRHRAVTTRSGRHQVPVAVLPTAKSLSAFSLKPQSDRLLGEMAVVLLVFMMVAALLARICTTLVAARPRFVVFCQMGFRTDRTSGEADGQKANSMPGMA